MDGRGVVGLHRVHGPAEVGRVTPVSWCCGFGGGRDRGKVDHHGELVTNPSLLGSSGPSEEWKGLTRKGLLIVDRPQIKEPSTEATSAVSRSDPWACDEATGVPPLFLSGGVGNVAEARQKWEGAREWRRRCNIDEVGVHTSVYWYSPHTDRE